MVDELKDDEGERSCPVCRSEMRVLMLECKTDDEVGLTWGKYCYNCSECGHCSASWETLD